MKDAEQTGSASWLYAGQELLRQGGAAAVKLQPLTAEIGLTTGSFYHHFSSMADYRDQLAQFYGQDRKVELAEFDHLEPRERLRAIGSITVSARLVPLDAAMRDWAGSNSLAAEAVRAVDEELMHYLSATFVELGYPRREARARSLLLQSVAVARVTPPWEMRLKDAELIFEILAP